VNVEWSQLPAQLAERLGAAGRLAAVLSPHLTVEEAYLLAQLVRSIDPDAVIAVGPIPVAGEDESFPAGFTIRAEKCPNRRGVEAVAKHFSGELIDWLAFLERAVQGEFGGAWIAGGYKTDWNTEEDAQQLSGLDLLVVQDLFASPLLEAADYRLPGAAFAEREGSYVNAGDRLQSFPWAIRAPAGVMVEGRLYWRLMERDGLYQSRGVLDEVARDILYFSAAAEPVPATGVDLKINQLAAAT